MADEKTEGFWQRLFGVKPAAASGCCSMKVDSVGEKEAQKAEEASCCGGPASASKPERPGGAGGCCCG